MGVWAANLTEVTWLLGKGKPWQQNSFPSDFPVAMEYSQTQRTGIVFTYPQYILREGAPPWAQLHQLEGVWFAHGHPFTNVPDSY